eukprot:6213323-Pleurochrysis_carterae.AAC.3
MAAAAIAKMYDPKISIADKLASQAGVNSYAINSAAHEATIGAHFTNDAVEASRSVQRAHALRLHAKALHAAHAHKNQRKEGSHPDRIRVGRRVAADAYALLRREGREDALAEQERRQRVARWAPSRRCRQCSRRLQC